ncbi:hypothetical protein D3C76_1700060 [compost metagenome]
MIQRQQQVLFLHLGDGVIRRNDHIEGGAALLHLGQHRFIRIKGLIDDRNAGLLLEFLQQRGVHIIAPVIDG